MEYTGKKKSQYLQRLDIEMIPGLLFFKFLCPESRQLAQLLVGARFSRDFVFCLWFFIAAKARSYNSDPKRWNGERYIQASASKVLRNYCEYWGILSGCYYCGLIYFVSLHHSSC